MYGIPLERLETLMGSAPAEQGNGHTLLAGRAEYSLERLTLRAGESYEIATGKREGAGAGEGAGEGATLFLEQGSVLWAGAVGGQTLLHIAPADSVRIAASGAEGATAYIFRGPASTMKTEGLPATKDQRSKYWGKIETIVNAGYTGKRLFFQKGKHSSLHYHCAKIETYFIHSGCLLVRLRAGRAQDRWFPLSAGMLLTLPPGLMHQSGALEDTVLIEVSTHDEDADSFLVEDGERCPMPRLQAMLGGEPAVRKRIVFDLDGCLCRQTAGDYEHAQPLPSAIAVVNRLYDQGHDITIHTARYMGRTRNNVALAYQAGFALTQQQLSAWGVRYHLLVMGKPAADIVVDDRALFFRPDWDHIAQEIEFSPGLHPLPNAFCAR